MPKPLERRDVAKGQVARNAAAVAWLMRRAHPTVQIAVPNDTFVKIA